MMALGVGVMLSALPLVWGGTGPADPGAGALPTRDTQAPEAGTSSAGTQGVIDATGAASYALPIAVPPGRLGMAPSLALAYSSLGSLRGGLAVGWSLSLPVIERDPRVLDGSAFIAGSQRLVENTLDPGLGRHFRAELDGSFTRYQLDEATGIWTVRTLDGHVQVFAHHDPDSTRWQLTRESDLDGNTIDYTWYWSTSGDPQPDQILIGTDQRRYTESVLASIEYTSNPAAGLGSHALVQFQYDLAGRRSCGGLPVGAATDHRFGAWRMSGGQQLDAVRTSVRDTPGGPWRLAREYHLSYDQAELGCDASALRYLEQVQVTAYDPTGQAITAPAIRFGYGPKHRQLDVDMVGVPFGGGEAGHVRGPTSALLDFDGDGWVDRVTMETGPRCTLAVYPGTGMGAFASTPTRMDLPTAAWYGGALPDPHSEGCTLTGQQTNRPTYQHTYGCVVERVAVSYQLVDWDGDGLVDVLTDLYQSSHTVAGGDF
ncbi:MAG TPA: SpvB/TcaC N-terminal domain-containing protein, partial [Kofleriaceae bacterium]|nr:SpvB/TcaC N-terminal domain-containing protein [Kofleriaceae bacterium]